ncbi:EAL domain-containing protein [Ruminococcus sp. FC2018]|uniref:EAL domain-containing protein n=1 Tax=Ruminococcus sp. FC2018 TaxID=1410617 RepID=UPI0006871621|nr:EAL domain-containing protein [Ruminococcus sp. FC2018]
MNTDTIFNNIVNALMTDYTRVYYVNAVTGEYRWYSADAVSHSLQFEQTGSDFFNDVIKDAQQVVYQEDRHIFTQDLQKDRLFEQIRNGTIHNITYRIMIDGKPVYHSLRLIKSMADEDHFILGVQNIDKQMHGCQEREKNEAEIERIDHIAASLADHYDTLYYVDMDTGEYFEYSSSELYKSLNIPTRGDDFFAQSRKNIRRLAHQDDIDRVTKFFYKDAMLKNLSNKSSVLLTYRIMINGEAVYFRFSQIWASDRKHVIVCVENIDHEIKKEQHLRETHKKTVTYEKIAESLASNYDVIYYVDSSDGKYAELKTNSKYGNLAVQEEGIDFFEDAKRNAAQIVHPDDKERIQNVLKRDYLISVLEDKKHYSTKYRIVTDNVTHFMKLTVMWSSDRLNFIIGVENSDEEVRKEKEQVKALGIANAMARRDELTGVKNKMAYSELESMVQKRIDSADEDLSFAVVVCDINNLKLINDTHGHRAGDEYICAACRLVCDTFTHSKVFRVGGDEFVAFLGSGDYDRRHELFDTIRETVRSNAVSGEGPIVAVGKSDYIAGKDKSLSDVFERADNDMYEEKNRLKQLEASGGKAPEKRRMNIAITAERRQKLEALFQAFSTVAEGSYVYLCDMKYDFSIWSKTAVETFGLPSQYMYGAGSIWEEHIHPEDRETYRMGINDIFTGNSSGHDMQYRARKLTGEYDVCTCKGVVLRDENGEPNYFGGAIRNHGLHGHVDSLTGLRNQYGFFEDLQANMANNRNMCICLVGISKFSEINEVYGYHFGNMVLQKFGRYLFEHVGNQGSAYRLDGTKFVVLSTSQSINDMKQRYEDLRQYYREKFKIDGKKLVLELNAGMINVDSFDIDNQTIYACLNFAYSESKIIYHGDAVEFTGGQTNENRHRIEQLHTIRASITQDYKGFYIVYQPVVDAFTNKLIGGEALLRWKSDKYGVVPPDSFIPVLERDPLFCVLGEWILKTSLIDAKKMREQDPDFVVHVNLSYSQLEKPDFVDMVIRTLQEADYPAQNLCLEVTERCRLLDIELLKNVIVNLRGMGVKIALDDFGTGFSSVSLLKELSFDIIKIDRSFIQNIDKEDMGRRLIEKFTNLASLFGASVCVEGVETKEMIEILRNYPVQSLQGYFYSKPLPFEQFKAWDHEE